MKTVFIPEPISRAGLDLLEGKVQWTAPWAEDRGMNEEEARERLRSSDAAIVRLFRISRDDMRDSPRMRVIAKHGVGVDAIELRAAREHGIVVLYTPEANSNAVAEHTVALLLALARRIEPAASALRAGRFEDRGRYQGVELAGKTLGLIGLGRIGRRVAEIATLGLRMKGIAFDPFVKEPPTGQAIQFHELEEVLRQSDFLSLHAPATPDTHHLIDAEAMQRLKPECRIINTARGALIDERALARALGEERIAGAALDVFEEEPLPPAHPLLKAPNLLMTPHISSSTPESMDRMAVDAAQGVLDVLEGRRPRYPYPMEAIP